MKPHDAQAMNRANGAVAKPHTTDTVWQDGRYAVRQLLG